MFHQTWNEHLTSNVEKNPKILYCLCRKSENSDSVLPGEHAIVWQNPPISQPSLGIQEKLDRTSDFCTTTGTCTTISLKCIGYFEKLENRV